MFQPVPTKTCLHVPAVGRVTGVATDTDGVVQGLLGLAFAGRTLQLPTVN